MLMLCKYSSEIAEDAIADVAMAAVTFLRFCEDEEQEKHQRPTHWHRQRCFWVRDVIYVCILLRCTAK